MTDHITESNAKYEIRRETVHLVERHWTFGLPRILIYGLKQRINTRTHDDDDDDDFLDRRRAVFVSIAFASRKDEMKRTKNYEKIELVWM